MVTENTTPNRGYQEPAVGNTLEVDVGRLIAALRAIDVDVANALAAIVSKAGLASPAFTGTPTAPTAAPGTDSGQLATTAFVKAALATLVGLAPDALDTIEELAAASENNSDLIDLLESAVALKADAAATTAALAGKADAAATTAALAGKADAATTIAAGTGLSGGGNLTANRTISADIANQPTAEAGLDNTKLMTPQNTRLAIDARAKFVHEYISAAQVMTGAGSLTLSHGLGVTPKLLQARIVCKVAEAGYSIGDEVVISMPDDSSSTVSSGQLVPDASVIFIRMNSNIIVGHKATGARTVLTWANWRLIVRAWA